MINVEKNIIDDKERNSTLIDSEIEDFLETNEGQNIKADIDLLNSMGFEKKMINKVYVLLRPENIERAIDYMTEIDGIYQHDFIASSNPREKNLCFICKKPKQNHLDYIPDDLLNENQNNLINNEEDIINVHDDIIVDNNKDNDIDECEVCYEEISKEDKKNNTMPCGHTFCNHCWSNYLKTLILEAKVDEIQCMDHECKENLSDEFILNHISEDNNLIEKYQKFKKRAEIIKDKNKKLCPSPDCDSFLQKSMLTNYVQCENGHKYCFECLKPPHGNKSCDYQIEQQFMKWTQGKRVKRCPRCKMFTEKNEGCNHMTCVTCKYQWCWLCEGKYVYGHYDSGKCRGHQFTKADNLKEIEKINNKRKYVNREASRCFGLHKIFKCIYNDNITRPFPVGSCLENFHFTLGFWFFGVAVIYIYTVMEYIDQEIVDNFGEKTETTMMIFVFLTGAALFVAFQISFFCLITPFILVAFAYQNFFYYIIYFFGFGE